jgi:tetratricopeptide (TPR) repeat protein
MMSQENRSEEELYGESDGDRFDVSTGDIGAGAQVAVGNRITQVGSLALNIFHTNLKPVMLLFVPVFALLAAILFILTRPDPQPRQMQGTFNIAVAAFDLLSDGRSHPSEQGERVATWLTNELNNQQPSYPAGTQIEIWGPEQTGRISGHSRDQRAQTAQTLAQKIGANIVIYGYLEEENNTVRIYPEFYVALADFQAGQEITGPHQMGSPIAAPAAIFANPILSAGLNRELNGRAVALSHFTIGLIFFALDDFQAALDAFGQARDTPGWENDPGKEVIYLFLGNAALNLQEWSEAHAWFSQALEVSPGYARAYVGHGLTYFQEAIASLPEQPADVELLEQSIVNFQAALAAPDQPPYADVRARVHFGLGRAYLVLSWQGNSDFWREAEHALRTVIDEHEAGNVRLQELSAQAYGQLGLLYYIHHRDYEAIQAYEQALELGRLNLFKAEWARHLSDLYREQGDQQAAAQYAHLAAEYGQ